MFDITRSTANNIAILTGFEKLYFQYDNYRRKYIYRLSYCRSYK